jgi:hypothetical protein
MISYLLDWDESCFRAVNFIKLKKNELTWGRSWLLGKKFEPESSIAGFL